MTQADIEPEWQADEAAENIKSPQLRAHSLSSQNVSRQVLNLDFFGRKASARVCTALCWSLGYQQGPHSAPLRKSRELLVSTWCLIQAIMTRKSKLKYLL